MAIDLKYGRVKLEHGDIGEDEPVMVFRAQDLTLPFLQSIYRTICELMGSPRHHLLAIEENRRRVVSWQLANEGRVRVPNSNRYAERISGRWIDDVDRAAE